MAGRVSKNAVHVEIIRTAPADGLLFSQIERRYMSIEVCEALELTPRCSLEKELSGTIRFTGERGYLAGTSNG